MKKNHLPRYRWYIEPDVVTNDVLRKFLPPENAHSDLVCSDGEPHNLWDCPSFETIAKLSSVDREWGLHYKIWVQKLPYGAIRRWKLGLRRACERMVHA